MNVRSRARSTRLRSGIVSVFASCFVSSFLVFGMDPTNNMDIDGDGKTDIAIYREGCQRTTLTSPCPSYTQSTFWYIASKTNTQHAFSYGRSLDFPVSADYNGDGKTDFAVYRWFEPAGLLNDMNAWIIDGVGSNFFGNVYGRKAPRNFSGLPGATGATAEVAELRRDLVSKNPNLYSYTFYWQTGESFSSTATGADTATERVHQFAVPQDYLVGDQVSEVAVFQVKIAGGSPEVRYKVWSNPGTVAKNIPLDPDVNTPAPGDYDGNGLADYGGVVRTGTNLTWKVKHNRRDNEAPLPDINVQYGGPGAVPVPADYDGDLKTDLAYALPVGNGWQWHIQPSGGGTEIVVSWGLTSDVLMPQPYFADPWY